MKNLEDKFKNDKFFQDPHKYFRNKKIEMIVIFVVLTVVIAIVLTIVGNKANKELLVTKSFLGKKCIVEKDTLTIINYSTFMSTYKLSNGVDYDMDFVKYKVIK